MTPRDTQGAARGSPGAPEDTQGHPNTWQKPGRKRASKTGSVSASFLPALASPWETPGAPRDVSMSHHGRPGAPTGPPEVPQGGPQAFPGSPREPPRTPRDTQGTALRSPGVPEDSQGHPNTWQKPGRKHASKTRPVSASFLPALSSGGTRSSQGELPRSYRRPRGTSRDGPVSVHISSAKVLDAPVS